MCNLYKLSSSRTEVADFFEVAAGAHAGNAPAEIYPGYPGMVVAEGAVRQMVWGFPLPQKGAKGQPLKPKPVNNARSDKLSGPFWRASFVHRRCLIPANAYAEAEGPRGGKTRTWLAPAGEELFALAGIWRESEEWGPAYSMVIADAAPQVAAVHHRMPVVVPAQDRATWLSGTPEEAYRLCRPYTGDMTIARTSDPWVARR